MTWQCIWEPGNASERTAQDLSAKGKVKAFGKTPKRSIWRYKERACGKREWFASCLKRVFHGLVGDFGEALGGLQRRSFAGF